MIRMYKIASDNYDVPYIPGINDGEKLLQIVYCPKKTSAVILVVGKNNAGIMTFSGDIEKTRDMFFLLCLYDVISIRVMTLLGFTFVDPKMREFFNDGI